MEMSTVKTVAVFVIIFGCFAVLYPKIFHPIFMHILGAAPNKQTTDDVLNRIPPHLRHGRPMGSPEDTMRNMRAGSHPGLRAAAEMKKQAATSSPGGGKGMMSIVLPMYAVGIVVYLVYTLTKVFGKKDKPPGEDYLSNDPFKDIRYDAEKHKFKHRVEEEDEEEDEDPRLKEFCKSNTKKKDLENLLLKADDRTITEMEMRQLKDRLLETETQMNRILKAMEMVQRQVGQTAEEHMSQQAKAAMSELQKAKGPGDLSPDMDSYDIISGSSSPIEEIGPEDVSMEKSKDDIDYASRKNARNNPRNNRNTSERLKSSPGGSVKCQRTANVAESAENIVEDSDERSDEGDDRETSDEEEGAVEEIIETKEDTDDEHPDLRMRKTVDTPAVPQKDTDHTDAHITDLPESDSKKD